MSGGSDWNHVKHVFSRLGLSNQLWAWLIVASWEVMMGPSLEAETGTTCSADLNHVFGCLGLPHQPLCLARGDQLGK